MSPQPAPAAPRPAGPAAAGPRRARTPPRPHRPAGRAAPGRVDLGRHGAAGRRRAGHRADRDPARRRRPGAARRRGGARRRRGRRSGSPTCAARPSARSSAPTTHAAWPACSTCSRPGAAGTAVLVVDDADVVADRLDLAAPGRGVTTLGALVRGASRAGLAVGALRPAVADDRAVDGGGAHPAGPGPARRDRVAPRRRARRAALAARRRRPRRAPRARRRDGRPGGPRRRRCGWPARRHPASRGSPPLPAAVAAADLPAPSGDEVALGRGGDDGGPVRVACGPGARLLVVGPPGSGRTTALATVRDQLRRAGRTVAAPARPGAAAALRRAGPRRRRRLAARRAGRGWRPRCVALPRRGRRGGRGRRRRRGLPRTAGHLARRRDAAGAAPGGGAGRPAHRGRRRGGGRPHPAVPPRARRGRRPRRRRPRPGGSGVRAGEPAQGRKEGVPVWEV